MFILPVQLTTCRIGNLTRFIHTVLKVMTIHTYIHILLLYVMTIHKDMHNIAALKRLSFPAVTLGGITTLSASSTSLFLQRCSTAFSSCFLHTFDDDDEPACPFPLCAIDTTSYVRGSDAVVLQSPLISNIRVYFHVPHSPSNFSACPLAHAAPRPPTFQS